MPSSCSCRGTGRFRNRVHPAPQLRGTGWTVGKTGVDGREPAHPDFRHDETWAYYPRPTLRDRGFGYRKPATDREHGPGTLLHNEQYGRGFQSSIPRLLINHQLRSVVSAVEPDKSR